MHVLVASATLKQHGYRCISQMVSETKGYLSKGKRRPNKSQSLTRAAGLDCPGSGCYLRTHLPSARLQASLLLSSQLLLLGPRGVCLPAYNSVHNYDVAQMKWDLNHFIKGKKYGYPLEMIRTQNSFKIIGHGYVFPPAEL